MEYKHFVIFTQNELYFAIDAAMVREIIWLPELTPIEEVPHYIAGVFNLRGKIVPVMDLNIRFGHTRKRYLLSDKIIVLEAKGLIIGIIVTDVHDIESILLNEIEPAQDYGHRGDAHMHFVAGEAEFGENIIMVLDHDAILDFGTQSTELGMQNVELEEKTPHSALRTPNLEYSESDRRIFHERAKSMMQPPKNLILTEQVPLSVIGLGGEYFGVELDVIQEFSDIRNLTPVPCSPEHIAGDMNLRGDILTLIDIRGMLNITTKKGHPGAKAVVASVNDLVAGIAVEDVVEVINISPSEIRHVPAAVEAVSNEYIKGEFPYQGKMLSILDLKKILTSKEMVVEEK